MQALLIFTLFGLYSCKQRGCGDKCILDSPSQFEPAPVTFIKSDDKYLIKLPMQNGQYCATLRINLETFTYFRIRFRKCYGIRSYNGNKFQNRYTKDGHKLYLFNVEEVSQPSGEKCLKIFVKIGKIKVYWTTNNGFFLAGVTDDKCHFQFDQNFNFESDDQTGVLTTYINGNAKSTRRCLTAHDSENFSLNKNLIGLKRRPNFPICNIAKCNDIRIAEQKCSSCNWLGRVASECESCENEKLIPENGICNVLDENASCIKSWPGVEQLGKKIPELDEKSCSTCDINDNTKCTLCGSKNAVINNAGKIVYFDINPVNGVCKCPEGKVISYTKIKSKTTAICTDPCTNINDSLDSEENRCKSCDSIYGDRCAICEYEKTTIDKKFQCYCDTDQGYKWYDDIKSCEYKHKEHVNKLFVTKKVDKKKVIVLKEPLINFCIMYGKGTEKYNECVKNSK